MNYKIELRDTKQTTCENGCCGDVLRSIIINGQLISNDFFITSEEMTTILDGLQLKYELKITSE
jgi:hypothetical protein